MDIEVKKHIKTFAAICAVAMIFGSFSGAVFADGNNPTEINQDSIDDLQGILPTDAGNYILTEDISVTHGAKIETSDIQVTINLNGHTITYTGTESMYIVGKLRGINADGTGVPDANKTITGVTLTIEGPGTITGEGVTGTGSTDYWINVKGVGTSKFRGGCILVEWSNTFILEGATITGFEASDEGGAICVSNGATFVMNGGAITNCSAGKGGGAISGNASSDAQGPNGENITASVTINDGTISGNKAGQLGGGIRINRCHFYLNGGEITNNDVLNTDGTNGAGGIQILHSKNGSHVVEFQGSPRVYGNKAKGIVNADRANILLENCTITLGGDLSESAKLGFSSTSTDKNCFNINGKSYSLNSLVCDKEDFISYVSGSYVKMKTFTEPKVSGYNIGISGEILFNVYLNFGQAAQSDVSLSYTYSYQKTGSNKVVVNKDVDSTDFKTNDIGTYFVIPVESACMTAPITITLTYRGKEKVYTTTVEEVAKDSAERDSTYTDVVNALLTYGGYAQVQLKINTGTLPTVSGVDFSSPFDGGLTGTAYAPATDPNNAYYAGNVSFLSQTEVKMCFKKSALGDGAPSMNVTYASGATETITASPSGGYYVYTIKGPAGTGFPATQYNVKFDYTIGNDTVVGKYSVETYLKAAKASNTTSDAMKNLAGAYNNFALKCMELA